MGRRKKKQRKTTAAVDVPELTGLAKLLVEMPAEVLDLHGLTARQAESRIRLAFQRLEVTASGQVVHIITGKGTRSEGAPVLPALVRELLGGELAEQVEESAGLPGGGGLAVRIR